jgi:MFS transporter, DHA1 family, multidrug resistance protein
MNRSFFRNAVTLGLLTAIGPFAIDMYLPALPSVGASLGVSADAASISLTAFFVMFALGQLLFGPLSDTFGRKTPLYAGLVLFIVASVGCALAQDIVTLSVFRALQGLGGAAGMVISRAIVRDLHDGVEEAKLLSLLMLVFSVSPLLAPLVGSFVIEWASWHSVFWLVGGAAFVGLLLAVFVVPETRTRDARVDSSWRAQLRQCGTLMIDRDFMGPTLISSFALAGFFVFLAQSSFVLMGQAYGLSSFGYSFAFSVNAAAFFISMQAVGWLGARYGLAALIRPAITGYAAMLGVLLVLVLSGVSGLLIPAIVLFVAFGFMGLMLPASSVLALEKHGEIAGTASSLLGTTQLVIGSIAMAIAAAFANGTALPMVIGIAICGALACAVAWLMPIGRTPAQASAMGAASP